MKNKLLEIHLYILPIIILYYKSNLIDIRSKKILKINRTKFH